MLLLSLLVMLIGLNLHAQIKEKEIFSFLKGNLNAVTPADVMEELYRRLVDLLPTHLSNRVLKEANFLANFCLLCKSDCA